MSDTVDRLPLPDTVISPRPTGRVSEERGKVEGPTRGIVNRHSQNELFRPTRGRVPFSTTRQSSRPILTPTASPRPDRRTGGERVDDLGSILPPDTDQSFT